MSMPIVEICIGSSCPLIITTLVVSTGADHAIRSKTCVIWPRSRMRHRVRSAAAMRCEKPGIRGWLLPGELHLLCELGVEHPRRKKPGEGPVLEALWNDRVADL